MDLSDSPPDIYTEVIVDSFANIHGGRQRSEALLYFANFGIRYETQFGFSLHSELWLTDNQSISDIVGDEQGVSNIEASEAGLHIGMLAAGYHTRSWSWLIGVYDINYYFDVLDSANLFVHSAFGMGSVFGISGPNGPSTYPQPGLTAKLGYQRGKHSVQFAIADGEPGDPIFYYHTAAQEEKRINLLVVAEYAYESAQSKWLAGWWGYNDDSVVLQNAGASRGKNNGFYLRTEHRFEPSPSDYQITVFGRAGVGASKFNFFDEFYSVGLQVSGELWGFGDDQFGLAIAHARTSDARSPEYGSDETALELTYAATFNNGMTVQPSLQWIGSPGAAREANDAVVLGLRLSWSFN